MRVLLSEPLAEREHERLGADLVGDRLRVPPHALGVDLQARDDVRGDRQRREAVVGDVRHAGPLDAERPRVALVLPGHPGERDRRLRRRELRHHDHLLAPLRVPLVRHRARADDPVLPGLLDLADLGPRERADLVRDPSHRPGDRGQRGDVLDDPVARDVPAHRRRAEPEPGGEALEELRRAVAEAGHRPGAAEELRDEHALAHLLQAVRVAQHLVEPARDLGPERDRQRGARVRAADRDDLRAAIGERGEHADEALEVGLEPVEDVAHLEHLARVLDVLRRRAVVDVLAAPLRADRLEPAEQADERVPRLDDLGAHRLEVDVLDARRGHDAGRRLGRDQPELALRLRERSLDVEPALDAADVAEDRPARGCRVVVPVEVRVGDVAARVVAGPARRGLHDRRPPGRRRRHYPTPAVSARYGQEP